MERLLRDGRLNHVLTVPNAGDNSRYRQNRREGDLQSLQSPRADTPQPRASGVGNKELDQQSERSGRPRSTSEQASRDVLQISRDPTPAQYYIRDPGWWQVGRYFSIWAINDGNYDKEIHKKNFILLDSRSDQGLGVLVEPFEGERLDRLDNDSSARRAVLVLKTPHDPSPTQSGELEQSPARGTRVIEQLEKVFLDEFLDEEAHRSAAPGTQMCVCLDSTYNIPFQRYKCHDLGILDADSLEDLRLRYLYNLAQRWNVRRRLSEEISKRKTNMR